MKISGYILKFGEELQPGVVIDKNCKITFNNDGILCPVGIDKPTFTTDEVGVYFKGEVDFIGIGVGGTVTELEGNVIKSYKITEVSIIPKSK